MILHSYQYNLVLDNAFLLTFIQRFIIRINPEIGELQYINLIKVTPVMIPGTPQYIKHVFKCFPRKDLLSFLNTFLYEFCNSKYDRKSDSGPLTPPKHQCVYINILYHVIYTQFLKEKYRLEMCVSHLQSILYPNDNY